MGASGQDISDAVSWGVDVVPVARGEGAPEGEDGGALVEDALGVGGAEGAGRAGHGQGKKRTSPTSKRRNDWDRVGALTDERVRRGIEADPDAHPTDEGFWKEAEIVMPRPKETMTIRLDADVLDWIRRQGEGYQTRINAIRCSYMRALVDADA